MLLQISQHSKRAQSTSAVEFLCPQLDKLSVDASFECFKEFDSGLRSDGICLRRFLRLLNHFIKQLGRVAKSDPDTGSARASHELSSSESRLRSLFWEFRKEYKISEKTKINVVVARIASHEYATYFGDYKKTKHLFAVCFKMIGSSCNSH